MAIGRRKTVDEIIKDDNAENKGTIYRRGWQWWVEYYISGKRIRESLETASLTEAIEKRKLIVNPLIAGKEKDKLRAIQHRVGDAEREQVEAQEKKDESEQDKKRIKVTDAWNRYVANRSRPQSGEMTLKDFSQRWGKFANWWEVNRRKKRPFMNDVVYSDANDFANFLEDENLSPNRYNKIVQTCRLVFNVLQKDLSGLDNPFGETPKKGIANKPQARETKGRRNLSEAELLDVCSNATGEMRVMFAAGLYTSLRFGDVATLRWEEINLTTNKIIREPNKTFARTGKEVVIPIHPVLHEILNETPQSKRRDFVLPELAQIYLKDRTKLSKMIQQHFKSCGIKTTRERVYKHSTCEVGFHSLRHSFITICAKKGVPMPIVQELCGHRSEVIQKVYLDLGDSETQQAAVLAMPDILNGENVTGLKASNVHDDKVEAVKLLNLMTAKNWQGTRDKAIAVLSSAN